MAQRPGPYRTVPGRWLLGHSTVRCPALGQNDSPSLSLGCALAGDCFAGAASGADGAGGGRAAVARRAWAVADSAMCRPVPLQTARDGHASLQPVGTLTQFALARLGAASHFLNRWPSPCIADPF